jgi:hypothetical protein
MYDAVENERGGSDGLKTKERKYSPKQDDGTISKYDPSRMILLYFPMGYCWSCEGVGPVTEKLHAGKTFFTDDLVTISEEQQIGRTPRSSRPSIRLDQGDAETVRFHIGLGLLPLLCCHTTAIGQEISHTAGNLACCRIFLACAQDLITTLLEDLSKLIKKSWR